MIALRFLDLNLSICRLSPEESVPEWPDNSRFLSVTRTPFELSIVCETGCLPKALEAAVDSGWVCFKADGPLELTMTGVLASITAPLADARIPIFAVSSYDTDYILIKGKDKLEARNVLSGQFTVN
jgi:uncharacterized protein